MSSLITRLRTALLAALASLTATPAGAQPPSPPTDWTKGTTDDGAEADNVVAASEIIIDLSKKRNVTVEPKPLPAIQFELGTARLTELARRQLDQVVLALNNEILADAAIYIDGHTDASGSAGFNDALSRHRAQTALDYLVAGGIAANRLTARGYGESQPLDFETPESRMHRRVEISRQP